MSDAIRTPQVLGAIRVRPVTSDDFEVWKSMWDDYNAFYKRVGPTALPMEITDATWVRFFDGYEPMHAMIAELDGAAAGLVHYLYHRSTIHLGPVCYLQDLFTVARARGRGVGGALIHAVYARAQVEGARRVYWQTHETNIVAMRLYDHVADRSGFVAYRKGS